MFDFIVTNATLIDGSGKARYQADVGIKADRIVAIGDLALTAAGCPRFDAIGKVLCPGFIDVHTHADGWLKKFSNFEIKTTQGFTCEVLMADGISYAPLCDSTVNEWFYYLRSLNGLNQSDYRGWKTLGEYMNAFEGRTAQNVATHVPYGNVRSMYCGFSADPPNKSQMKSIQAELIKGMEVGAVGVSTGLEYLAQTFCSKQELIEALKAVASFQPLYVTHIRYPLGLVAAVKEAVEIGKAAGVPVHISHLKTADEKLGAELLRYIDEVAVNEVDFSFDVYPYAAASTMLNYLLPYEEWIDGALALKSRLKDPKTVITVESALKNEDLSKAYIAWLPSKKNQEFIGRPFTDYVEHTKLSAAQAILQLLDEEDLSVLIVFRRGRDEAMLEFVRHPKSMLGSDGVYQPGGRVHPRMYGSAARMLGPLVRDAKLFLLEEAVRKMSGYSAKRFGLKGRGVISEGSFADLVLLDPNRIEDRATYEDPTQAAVGVEAVFVNGKQIVRDSKAVRDAVPGRFLRYDRTSV